MRRKHRKSSLLTIATQSTIYNIFDSFISFDNKADWASTPYHVDAYKQPIVLESGLLFLYHLGSLYLFHSYIHLCFLFNLVWDGYVSQKLYDLVVFMRLSGDF